MVFIGAKLAVFVDGCFWHSCPQHSILPKNNRAFWEQKLARNRERDAENTAKLVAEGWRVLRIWEHDIDVAPAACALSVAAMVRRAVEANA